MSSVPPVEANAEQIRYWNEVAGPKWVSLQVAIDRQIRPLGHRALDAAKIGPGDRVIDVGCGCGDTTIEIARRVRPGGRVLGVDISEPMLARAREAAAGMPEAAFEQADAQTHRFPDRAFDVLYSRFGVMFFQEPAAAFRNLRSVLVPSGRLAFVCWQEVRKNPWMLVPLMTAAQHVTLPAPPGPEEPGPFSFGDPARVRRILEEAGFERVALEAIEQDLLIGGTRDLDETVDFILRIGPTAAAMREIEAGVVARLTEAVKESLAPYHTADGVRMGAAVWIVTASADRSA